MKMGYTTVFSSDKHYWRRLDGCAIYAYVFAQWCLSDRINSFLAISIRLRGNRLSCFGKVLEYLSWSFGV
jgi:hypothetical protein